MPLFQTGTKQGAQNFGGSGFIDLGISEALGSLGTKLFGAPNQSVLNNGAAFYSAPNNSNAQVLSSTSQAPTPSVSTPQYNTAAGPVYSGQKSQSVGSTGQSNSQANNGSLNTLNNNVQNQLQGGLSNVDSDYQNYLSTLDTQQGNVQRSAESAKAGVDTNAQAARTALQNEGITAAQSYDTQSQQANKQASTSLRQARDLFRQLQQQNIAQLSGLGISSSSVAEALAENLGVETARRIAGVTGSRDEVLQNISKEKANTENYVKQKMSDLEGQVAQQKNAIQTQLLNSIDQINNSRNVAANDRASKRQELIMNAQNAVAELQAKAQEFAQSLEQWKVQNSQKLQNTAISFDDLTSAMNAARNFQTMGLEQGQVDPQAASTQAYYINPTTQKNPYEFDYSQYGL